MPVPFHRLDQRRDQRLQAFAADAVGCLPQNDDHLAHRLVVYGERYAAVVHSWRRRWEEVIPFFAFSSVVRKVLYTTNAIESLYSQVRRAIRNKGHFPSDEADTKLIYLALRNITAKWKNPPREWHAAKAQFAIQSGDRFVLTV